MRRIFCLLTAVLLKHALAETFFEHWFPQDFIYSRCKNISNEALKKDVEKQLQLVDGYFENIEEPIFCSNDINKVIPLMKQITVNIQPCFKNNETYIPNFMYEGFVGFAKFVCGNRTTEIFFSDQGKDCVQALSEYEYEHREKITNCSSRLYRMFDNDVLTYDHVCFQLNSAQKCFDEAIDSGCPHFVAFRSLNRKFFRAVGTLCNRATGYLRSSILTTFVFLSLHFLSCY